MLYELWRDTARRRGAAQALADTATGRRWSFAALAAEAERLPRATELFAFPTGRGAEFVLETLRAWRDGAVLCPLEEVDTKGTLLERLRQSRDIPLPEGCIHLKLTSGSTGAPRLVAFSDGRLAADAAQIVRTMGLRPEWPNLGVISMAHSYGFSNLVTPLLLHGIPLVLAGTPLPENVRRAAALADALTLPAVPAMWQAWHAAGAVPPHTRRAISAGAALDTELERAVHTATGVKIHNFYGASECGGIAYDRSEAPRDPGAPLGGVMDGVTLTVDGDGCLEVHSPAVGLGCWPEDDPGLGGGVFRTGDLAELCDGHVRLRGRAGDLINVAGRKVSPETVEAALRTHPAVRACVVFSVPDEDDARGERIVACVASEAAVETLRQHLLALLPAWQVPRAWHFEPSLSTNVRGKISRAEWRAQFLAGR